MVVAPKTRGVAKRKPRMRLPRSMRGSSKPKGRAKPRKTPPPRKPLWRAPPVQPAPSPDRLVKELFRYGQAIPPKGRLVLGVLAAGYLLLGYLNSRNRSDTPEDAIDVSWGQASNVGESRWRFATQVHTPWNGNPPNCSIGPSETYVFPVNWSAWGKYSNIERVVEGGAGSCGGSVVHRAFQTMVNGTRTSVGFSSRGTGFVSFKWTFAWEFRNGASRSENAPTALEPLELPPAAPWLPEPEPLRRREDEDEGETRREQPWAPETPPVPTPQPLAPSMPPDAVPLQPFQPLPLDDPGQASTAVPLPLAPRGLLEQSTPVIPQPIGPQPGPSGQLRPQELDVLRQRIEDLLRQTQPGTEIFGPVVIGQPSQAPPATMEGIASEVGRIEQKLRAMLPMVEAPAIEFPEPPPAVDLGPVIELLQLIAAELFAPYEADSYELQGPCARDQNGNPLPPDVAQWQAGQGKLNRLGRQIDAVALLLQFSKDQGQPVCTRKPIGQEVTVTFEEV